MTTVNTNFVFPASSESAVTWGRTLTADESASLQAKKGAMLAAGKFGSFPFTGGTLTWQWVNAAAANEWVAFCNTFSPPPASAIVQDIPVPAEPAPADPAP